MTVLLETLQSQALKCCANIMMIKKRTHIILWSDGLLVFVRVVCRSSCSVIIIKTHLMSHKWILYLTLSARQTKTNTCSNNIDPDETASNEPSHEDLHYLPFFFFI